MKSPKKFNLLFKIIKIFLLFFVLDPYLLLPLKKNWPCSTTCGLLDPQPGIEPVLLAAQS